jgi:uncharacterized protein (TIGR03086 family)
MPAKDTVELLNRTMEQTCAIISRIRPDQASLATPCTEWDVRTLVNHTVYGLQLYTAFVTAGELPSADADLIGNDWTNAYRAAADSQLAAWHRRGTAGTLQLRMGERPAVWVANAVLEDQTVHGWDLASATGQATNLDQEVGQAVLDWLQENIGPFRGRVFGPEVPVPEDAPLYDRLAGFCGRRPNSN